MLIQVKTNPVENQLHGLSKLRDLWAVLFLALSTLLVFWSVFSCGFVDYDDNDYVTHNPNVQKGLTKESIEWAFTHAYSNNYHPLTWISHMADVELYGLNPTGHHATNLLLHILSTLLLFMTLRTATGAFWRSLTVAAFFALHPLRVESVAWVAERKDVLSLFFAISTIFFYVRYAQERLRREANQTSRRLYYFLAFFCFVLGLLSKPMLVTLPFMLVLLDFWPLQRFEISAWPQLRDNVTASVNEKLAFFFLIIPAVITTIWAQKTGGALKSITQFPLLIRVENAPVALVNYLRKMILPIDLAVLYPYPPRFSFFEVAFALVCLAAITFVVMRYARRFPVLPVGWFWFVGGLIPVIGLVQVGEQCMADRYTYLPMIGLLFAVAWCLPEFLPKKMLIVAASISLAACMVITQFQVQFWKNNFVLFARAATAVDNNYVAHYNLANMLLAAGDSDAALAQYRESIRSNPSRPEPRNNYATALAQIGKTEEALAEFTELIRLHPEYAKAFSNAGAVLATHGRVEEAATALAEATRLDPNDFESQFNFANVLFRQAKTNDALLHFAEAIRLDPKNAAPHYWSGRLTPAERPKVARDYYLEALRLRPDWVLPMNELAWMLATHPQAELRNGSLALRYGQRACELTSFKDAKALAALEVASAENGKFTEALSLAAREIEILQQSGHPEGIGAIEGRIKLYRLGKPFRQP